MTLRGRLETIMDRMNDCARELHELSGGQTEWNAKPGLRELHRLGSVAADLAEEIESLFEDPNNRELVAQEVE